MTEPVNRTILLFDIEKFGTRDDVEQAFLRRLLYDVADGTLNAAGVSETARLRTDRGDAVVELIDANVPVSTLVKALLTETPMLLHAKNRLMASSTQIRLRIVLAAGYVALDENGWVGSDLNHAFRLLDADPLREALKSADGSSVLCVSDSVYQGVVRHGHHGVRPEEFHQVTVEAKEGPTSAWLHQVPSAERNGGSASLPGSPGPGGSTGSPSGSTQIMGSQYGVAGGDVNGNLSFDFRGDDRGGKQ
ncbi:hypothetical protein [Streptomyces sp. MZ04]|uniref:hypothetical protein n=1 Tax=Streptomyces sp. MZ04 TaxID=2559236 RepID=UPI00107E7B27|nr:hypothetical protein [Streptomyces sp. MZ04]TGB08149.1 hypothetical protein E2651_19980 [Streptomyces sp. MZ04]